MGDSGEYIEIDAKTVLLLSVLVGIMSIITYLLATSTTLYIDNIILEDNSTNNITLNILNNHIIEIKSTDTSIIYINRSYLDNITFMNDYVVVVVYNNISWRE